MTVGDPRTLPDGFEVRLRGDLLRAAAGSVLVGGSPVRAVRLSERARTLLVGDRLRVTDTATGALARRLLDGNLADPVLAPAPVPAADLTVVVPVRDRAAQLDRCLAALHPLPVLVVDDASRDPAALAEVAGRHGAEVLPLARNVGPAGARNAGLARVRTQLVAFVDSDVVVDAATLLGLARHCADARVALVGPRVAGRVTSTDPRWFERYDAAASSLDVGTVGGRVGPGAVVGWLPSACLVGRVAHLGAGFDDDWRVAEDVDLVWRLADAGLVVRYDPSYVAHHEVRGSVRGWLGRKVVYGTGGADLAARHGGKVAPAVLSPITGLAAAALLQRRWWSLPVAALAVASSTRSLQRRLPAGSGDLALRLSVRGVGGAVKQEAGLLLRHWWPLAALGGLVSARARRALVTALLVDLWTSRRTCREVGLPIALVGRRLDDLAYGTGLWWGALRRRSPACLVPRRPG